MVFLAADGTGIDATEDEAMQFVHGHLEAGTLRMPALEGWLRERAIPYASS